jgi:Nucleotidyl transferase AbiEii toxin, Type IV TA system
MDFDRFLDLLRALNREGVAYVLVGAVALNLHGIVRATEDIDLFIRPDTENVEKLKRALGSVWNDPDIAEITADDLGGEYPTIRYGPPNEGFVIDLLARLGSAFTFEDLEVQMISIEGVPVRVAAPTTLYRMKKDTIRPIDKADVAALREKFGIEDR